VAGWLCCALTGLLVSPISWDHHWVWIAPGLAAGADAALRASGRARQAAWGLLAALGLAFAAWPSLWNRRAALVPWGLIWYPPGTAPGLSERAPHPEYAWQGIGLLAGNAYLLCGLAALAVLLAAAARSRNLVLGTSGSGRLHDREDRQAAGAARDAAGRAGPRPAG
jgi:alpha-1,2-mannosyltransferase